VRVSLAELLRLTLCAPRQYLWVERRQRWAEPVGIYSLSMVVERVITWDMLWRMLCGSSIVWFDFFKRWLSAKCTLEVSIDLSAGCSFPLRRRVFGRWLSAWFWLVVMTRTDVRRGVRRVFLLGCWCNVRSFAESRSCCAEDMFELRV
jgi:hypothetical protein